MAKLLVSPFEIKIIIGEDGAVVEVSAHYELNSEYGSLGRKGIPITLTPAQKTMVGSVAKNIILPQIKVQEGI